MAINSKKCDDNNKSLTSFAMSSTGSELVPNSSTSNSLIGSTGNSNYKRRINRNNSVFLSNNSVHMRSLTEDKSKSRVLSSFQLAAKLYKSNSDEFKLMKKTSKKSNRKSVLTLPNESVALPQSYTVSDMNGTEYCQRINKPKPQKPKKRQPLQKKSYYDRDAKYSSQIYLDCNSIDVVKNFNGDCQSKASGVYNSKTESKQASASDVWAVLRNINRFQLHPSPPMSDDSSYDAYPRKMKALKKRVNGSVYETCRTERIALFSNIELNIPNEGSLTGSSQITVIDNQNKLNRIREEEEVKNTTFEQNVPFVNLKNKRQNMPKENKKSRVSSSTLRTKKNSSSKDTLISQSMPVKPEVTSNKGDGRPGVSLGKNVCMAVEKQIDEDIKQTEVDKSQVNPHPLSHNYVSDTGTMINDLPNQNIPVRQEINLQPRRSTLTGRVPSSKTQLRPNIPPRRPLTIASSKVVCSQPQGLTFSKLQDSPRAPHRAIADSMQPLTQTDIRRIVAKIKFPLVILGKDEVSGTYKVEPYDYPQFRGLDEHIWPFMVDWMAKPQSHDINKETQSKKHDLTEVDCTKRSKKGQMSVTQGNAGVKQNGVAKVKPVSRFRDNLMKLLYNKKASNQNVGNNILPDYAQRDLKVKPVQTSNCLAVNVAISSNSIAKSLAASSVKRVTPRLQTTPPPPPTSPSKILIPQKKRDPQWIWGKAKKESEFIESVINKINNGTYYSSELPTRNFRNQSRISDLRYDLKDKCIQVTMPIITEDFTPKVTIQKKNNLPVFLPGFDDAVPQLELKSMTRSQIAVKHCVMNVLLEFDVNIPPHADRSCVNLKRSTSCVPLTVTESKTKVLKCKTRIPNSMLPAELCSLIPKVMKSLDKDAPLAFSEQETNRNESLSTISETTVSDTREHNKPPSFPQIVMSSELRKLSDGRFSKNSKSWAEKSNSSERFFIITVRELLYQYRNIEGLLSPQLSIHPHDYLILNPSHTLHDYTSWNSTEPNNTLSTLSPSCVYSTSESNLCTDLVPYTGNKVAHGGFTVQNVLLIALKEFFSTMLMLGNSKTVSEYFPKIQMETCNNRVYVNFSFRDHRGIGTSLCIDPAHFKYEPLCNLAIDGSSNTVLNYKSPGKQIEYIKQVDIKETNRKETRKPEPNVSITKTRKKGHVGYVKLYKKCKSTSHIVVERLNTPLSKVTNLNDFFRALGTGKLLSSVFDGSYGNKIMACISDLKMYTTLITPRQALLVMLLANKRDTSNLVRFRPVILQGIAVNRITRVSELDLEVDVIEKERLNEIPEFFDASSIIEGPPNNDHLLEELIWIAKTTASDYQRRFDDSSEMLLKTLLEKRKQLNPSYLRVMARYVGLGLLKNPVNR